MQSKTHKPFAHRYLRPQDLRALRNVFFSSKQRVSGLYAGRHASPQRGHSIEFNDYREYTPGDELGDVDWKVYGRSNKLFIKLFEHQSDMRVFVLVDGSASMAYRGFDVRPGTALQAAKSWLGQVGTAQRKQSHAANDLVYARPSKYDLACLMAASIAFLTIKQQDKIAFGMAQDGLRQFVRPSGGFVHLHNVLTAMETLPPGGEAKLPDALDELAMRAGRRGLLIVFSDLLEDQEAILRSLSQFTHRGSEVIVFQTLHAEELRLPDLSEAIFVDSESHQRMRLNVEDIRGSYDAKMKSLLASWSTAFRIRGIDYNLVSTATPYHKALERYLFSRAAML